VQWHGQTWTGKAIRRVLEWLLNRDLTDADMAAALDVHPSNYSRHKDDEGYPSFEQLATLGEHFHVSPRMLQIAFGLLDADALVLLDEDEMKQYLEQGGGSHIEPTRAGEKMGPEKSSTFATRTPATALRSPLGIVKLFENTCGSVDVSGLCGGT
jgi:hypothetical protein